MPTVNPRITLTIQPHRHDLLKRLSALQGVSMAALVSDILEEFYPVMERVCAALEMAQHAQQTSRQGLRNAAIQAEANLAPLAASVMDQFDQFMKQVEGSIGSDSDDEPTAKAGAETHQAEAVGAFSAASQKRANPRLVTRGSGTKTPKPSNVVKSLKSNDIKGNLKQ